MPVTYEGAVATLAGSCTVEESEALLEWLRLAAEPAVDLAGLGAVHSAVVQVLLATAPRLLALPPDPILAAALVAGLPAHALPPQVTA